MAYLRIALFLVFVAGASRATAQSATSAGAERTSEYKEAVKLATEEFGLGNYAEARALFERAHEIDPNARTLRGLGLTEFELRNYPASVRLLEAALASDVKPLTGEVRTSTESVLQRAQGYIGRVRLVLEPPEAHVSLDGQPIEDTSRELVLSVGDHVLEFSATGRATQRRNVRIAGRGRTTLKVVLQPLQVASPSVAAAHTGERRSEEAPVVRKWWLWTSIAAVAAGAAVATFFLVRREPSERAGFYETPNTPAGFGLELPPAGAK